MLVINEEMYNPPQNVLCVVHLDDSLENSAAHPESHGQPHLDRGMPLDLRAYVCLGVETTLALRTFIFLN